jgi:hypothetical protein
MEIAPHFYSGLESVSTQKMYHHDVYHRIYRKQHKKKRHRDFDSNMMHTDKNINPIQHDPI